MSLLASLERRFGSFAISRLIHKILLLNAVLFVLGKLNPAALSLLTLDRAAVWHGEVWRLVTFLFVPSLGSAIWMLFFLLFMWTVAEGLEQAMSAFRINLYYLVGALGMAAASLVFGVEWGNELLNSSLFFAFAWYYPEQVFYFFMILPLKVRWIAWAQAALLGWLFGTTGLEMRVTILLSLANFFLFFGPEILLNARLRGESCQRRREYQAASLPETEPLHRCIICGKTEQSHPQLDFRVGADGNDYCMEHLELIRK